MTTLADKLARIAEHVPEFRVSCRALQDYPEWVDNTRQLDMRHVERHPDDCSICNSKGYVPRPAHELAETLWKAGWELNISWSHRPRPDTVVIVVNKPGKYKHPMITGTDANEVLADAVLAALEAK